MWNNLWSFATSHNIGLWALALTGLVFALAFIFSLRELFSWFNKTNQIARELRLIRHRLDDIEAFLNPPVRPVRADPSTEPKAPTPSTFSLKSTPSEPPQEVDSSTSFDISH